MLFYNFNQYFNSITLPRRRKVYSKFDKRVKERFHFELEFKTKQMNIDFQYLSNLIELNTYYNEINDFLYECLVSKMVSREELVSKILIKNKRYKDFIFNLYIMYEFELFADFINSNKNTNVIAINRVKHHHILVAYQYDKKIRYKHISQKDLEVANELGVYLFSENDEYKRYELNDYGFDVVGLSYNDKGKFVDLRQFFKTKRFYVYPKMLKEFLTPIKKQTTIVFPLFEEHHHKIFSSSLTGIRELIFNMNEFYKEIMIVLSDLIKSKTINIVIPGVYDLLDYELFYSYIKLHLDKLNMSNTRLGIYLEDVHLLEELVNLDKKKPKKIIVEIEKMYYNDMYTTSCGNENVFSKLIEYSMTVRDVLRDKNIPHTLKLGELYNDKELETFLIRGYSSLIFSHNNIKNWSISAQRYLSRRS